MSEDFDILPPKRPAPRTSKTVTLKTVFSKEQVANLLFDQLAHYNKGETLPGSPTIDVQVSTSGDFVLTQSSTVSIPN